MVPLLRHLHIILVQDEVVLRKSSVWPGSRLRTVTTVLYNDAIAEAINAPLACSRGLGIYN